MTTTTALKNGKWQKIAATVNDSTYWILTLLTLACILVIHMRAKSQAFFSLFVFTILIVNEWLAKKKLHFCPKQVWPASSIAESTINTNSVKENNATQNCKKI